MRVMVFSVVGWASVFVLNAVSDEADQGARNPDLHSMFALECKFAVIVPAEPECCTCD